MKDIESHTEKKESWDTIISPRSGLLDIDFRAIWRYRDLVWLFVRRDFVAQYKQTILGPLWHVIQPIFTTIMFLLVFGRIANIPTDGIEPALFYMSGITIWNYFSACLINTSNTFSSNAAIFGKVYFPRLVLPLSIVISNIVRFGIQFLLLLSMMAYYYIVKGKSISLGGAWLCIPLLVLMMAGIGLGLGIIISSLTTRYRDFAVLLGFAIQLAMYATPVAYPLSFLKQKSFKRLIDLNPLTSIVECFRYSLFGRGSFTIGSIAYSFVFMTIVLFVGILIFNKVEKTFMDTV